MIGSILFIIFTIGFSAIIQKEFYFLNFLNEVIIISGIAVFFLNNKNIQKKIFLRGRRKIEAVIKKVSKVEKLKLKKEKHKTEITKIKKEPWKDVHVYDNCKFFTFVTKDNKEKVIALVTINKKQTLIVDGKIWKKFFDRILYIKISGDGKKVGALVEINGKFTLAINGEPWCKTFDWCYFDFEFSPNGKSVATIVGSEENGKYTVIKDDILWEKWYDWCSEMKFSPNGEKIAVIVEDNGKSTIAVNGRKRRLSCEKIDYFTFLPDNKTIVSIVRQNKRVTLAIDNCLLGTEQKKFSWHYEGDKNLNNFDFWFDEIEKPEISSDGKKITTIAKKDCNIYYITVKIN